MYHLCGKKSRPQTKPKKRECSESTLVEKKNTTINIRTTETNKRLGTENTWGNTKQWNTSVEKNEKGLTLVLQELKQMLQTRGQWVGKRITSTKNRVKQDDIPITTKMAT